jgi:hypothetical protein
MGGCSHAILWSENSGVFRSRVAAACATEDSSGLVPVPGDGAGRCRGREKKVKFTTPSLPAAALGCVCAVAGTATVEDGRAITPACGAGVGSGTAWRPE